MEDYARFHQNRTNLLIHLVTVPIFIAGALAFLLSLLLGKWVIAAISSISAILAFGLQGYGHSLETVPPRPFTGPVNFAERIAIEQFYTFPRFLLSGRWLIAWRRASASAA